MENIIRIRQSQMPIHSIADFIEHNSSVSKGVKEACFVRLIGTNAALASDICQLESKMARRMSNEPDFIYNRILRLPVLSSPSDIAYYGSCYEAWVLGKKEYVSSRAIADNTVYNRLLGGALKQVAGMYATGRPPVSESMERNFIAKMLFWHDSLLCGVLSHWDEQLTAKLVLCDLVLEQQYLFACLLALLGYDVLLLQCIADISEQQDARGMSQKIVLGEFGTPGLLPFDPQKLMMPEERYVFPGQIQAPAGGSRTAAEAPRPVTIKLPPHPGRSAKQQGTKNTGPSRSAEVTIPPRPGRAARQAAAPAVSKAAAEKSFEELAQLASSVVMIAIHGANGDIIGTGSGIMVGKDGYILTNNHVACGGRYYSVRIEDDETVYTTDELIKYHSRLDLAILRIDQRLKPLPIYQGKAPLVRGQKVVAIGSPLGLFNSVSDGIISGFRKIDGVDMIQFTAPTSHGSSGGAVLNMSGQVIGISTAGFDAGQNINLAMGYECISRFISGFV